jgi:acyl carrier protein
MTSAHDRLLELWLSRWPARDEGLVAFAVPGSDAPFDAGQLYGWLQERLPAYMIPQRIFTVPELPLNASGKLDRRALRPPAWPAEDARPAIPPRTPIEETMATLFEQVLGVRPHSVDEDFFTHLGGHSLAATRLATLVRRQWPITFPLRAVFECPTVAALAGYVEQACIDDPEASIIPRQPRHD